MASNSTLIFLNETPVYDALDKIGQIDPSPIIHAALASGILIFLAWKVSKAYRSREQAMIPDKKTFSVANLLEQAIGGLIAFMEGIMGQEARRFVPLIGGTALFILINNLMGSLPGFDSSSANINTTLACAIVIFIATHVIGIRIHGVKYIKHFMGPVLWLAPLMLIIELISHLARILSLSIRLFGNMMGDHTVLATFMGLVAIGVPVIFMGMGLFIAFIQTFVFTLLSIIYISGALEEAH
jgi:F-type H+-transporting ATPase subunit a